MKYSHVRDRRNHPFATIAYRQLDDGTFIAAAARCMAEDNFARATGRSLASERATNDAEVAYSDENLKWVNPFFDCSPIKVQKNDIVNFIKDAKGVLKRRTKHVYYRKGDKPDMVC